MTTNNHVGSTFDDFLEETGELVEVNAIAIKRVIAWEISEKMRIEHISKIKMAEKLETSRSALDRLLDPTNTSITLNTLDHAARAIGKKINIQLVSALNN